MLTVEKHEVTQLLVSWSNGDRTALDRLTPILVRRAAPARRVAPAAELRSGDDSADVARP